MLRAGAWIAILVMLAAGNVSLAFTENWIALLVGNSAYAHTSELKEPRNAAKDMAVELRRPGSVASKGSDLERAQVRREVIEASGGKQVPWEHASQTGPLNVEHTVEEKTGRACPPECCTHDEANGDGCVRKICPAGELPTSTVQCIARANRADKARAGLRKVAQYAPRRRRPPAYWRPRPRGARYPPRWRAPRRPPRYVRDPDDFCVPGHRAEFLRCK